MIGSADIPARGFERGGLAQWSLSFVAVVALHGAAAWAVLAQLDEGQPPGGPPAITIDLAAMAIAPSPESADMAPGPEQIKTAPTPEAEETPETPPIEEVVTEEPVPPEVQPVQMAEVKVDQPPPEPTPVQDQVPIPDVLPAPAPEAVVPPPPQKVEQQKPPPKKKPLQRSDADTTGHASASSVAERAAEAEAVEGNRKAESAWRTKLVAHIQRNKRYPAEAQARKQQGSSVLNFTIDSKGQVLTASLVTSSGVSSLDRETLAMIRRANPLPPAPAGMGGTHNFTVPILFNMR